MGKLTIYREPAAWMDRARSYTAEVDGVDSGKVANGGTLEVELKPGPHRVRMKVDWCSSRELTVDGSEDTRLHCAPGANPFLALLYIIFWRKDYILLRRA
jgi:hypothetical protein